MGLYKPIPDSTLKVLWFLGGLGSTGAVWFFLSNRHCYAALITGCLTAWVFSIALKLERHNEALKADEPVFSDRLRFLCMLLKEEHEYDDTPEETATTDPWSIHRQALTEFNALLCGLTEEQARVLTLQWLSPKSWEDRLNIARALMQRLPDGIVSAQVHQMSIGKTLQRLANLRKELCDLSVAEKDSGKPLELGERANPGLSLLKSIVLAGKDHRDAMFKQWTMVRPVLRPNL